MSVAGFREGSAESHPESTERSATLDRLNEELLRHIEQVEAELERYRSRDQLTSKALLAASGYAMRIREEARREADAVLHKASAKARARLADAERERRRAEREVVKLRNLADDLRAGLSGFLSTMVSRLEDDVKPAPLADAASETPPDQAPPGGGTQHVTAPANRATDAELDRL